MGAILLNKKGERFVNQLLPRDVVSQAIFEEMKKDGTEHVWLSFQNVPKETIQSHFPNIQEACRKEGYDITKEIFRSFLRSIILWEESMWEVIQRQPCSICML